MLDFSLVLTTLFNRLSSNYTLSLQLLVSVKPKLTFWQLSTKLTTEMYKTMYCDGVLCCVLVQLLIWGGGKELLRNIT